MPNRAEEVDGSGGLRKVVLQRESGASCEVYVYAAHITSWKTDDGVERLYLSSATEFEKGKAFRGGVPICWPQFAGRGPYMKHGFARNTDAWKVRTVVAEPDPCVTLELRDCEESKSWPFSFIFSYTVRLEADGALTMGMHIVNPSNKPLTWTGALHQYFAISDVANVTVSGLQGITYEDNTKGGASLVQQEEMVTLEGETDRLYFEAPNEMILLDGDNAVSVQKTGFPDAVVWNIGGEKAPGMKDLGEGEWRQYVCVEAVVAQTPVEIAPGESWSGSQRFVAGLAVRGEPIYYSADDRSQPMPRVTAEDAAKSRPMTAEEIHQYLPLGVPPGFMPMLVGADIVPAPGSAPAAAEAATKKKKSKLKVSKKKKKGCC